MEKINNGFISYKKVDKNIIVSLNHISKLNSINSSKIKSELLQLIYESETSIFLDFSEMKFIDSAGFQALLSAYLKAKLEDANFIICNANKEILELFNAVGLNKVFDIKNTELSFSDLKTAS